MEESKVEGIRIPVEIDTKGLDEAKKIIKEMDTVKLEKTKKLLEEMENPLNFLQVEFL